MSRNLVITFLVLAACSSPPPLEDVHSHGGHDHRVLEPPAEGQGIQLRLHTSLEPGQEIERCRFFQIPDSGLNISSQKTGAWEGIHHVLLYRTPYGEIPTVNRLGETVATGGVFDCPGPIGEWQTLGIIGGTQASGSPDIGTLAPGLAIVLPPRSVVLLNLHALNSGTEPLEIDSRMNLFNIPSASVIAEAGITAFYNPFIKVPGSGTADARMTCPVTKDVQLVNAQSHMHARGVGFTADVLDGAGAKLESIYQSNTWHGVPMTLWPEGKKIPAGSVVDYRCHYENRGTGTVYQGFTSSDEMCMLIAAYHPRDEAFERCNPVPNLASFALAGTYYGSGTADGPTTLRCLSSAKLLSRTNYSEDYISCVTDACPQIARQTSSVVQCTLAAGRGVCGAQCQADPAACGACIAKACGPAFSALSAARCQ